MTLLSLGTGLEKEVRKQADVLGAHLVVTPKGWCAYEQISVLTGETLPEAIPDADVKKIASIKGLQAFPYLTQRTAIQNQPVPVVGILSEPMKAFKKWEIEKGDYRLDERGVVVGHGIAKQFEVSVDDVVSVRRKDFRIRGILSEVGNRDDLAVYLDLPVAQALYGVGDKVSFVSVKVDDISQIDKYILEIQNTANVAVVSDKQLLKSVLGIVGAVGNALQLIQSVVLRGGTERIRGGGRGRFQPGGHTDRQGSLPDESPRGSEKEAPGGEPAKPAAKRPPKPDPGKT